MERRWPGGCSQARLQLLVLDDVGPVFHDPLTAQVLLVHRESQEVAGVVEGELAGLELVDDVAAVGWCGVEDLFELSAAVDHLARGAVDSGRLEGAVGGVEPVPGLGEPGAQLVSSASISTDAVGVAELPAGDGVECVVPGA